MTKNDYKYFGKFKGVLLYLMAILVLNACKQPSKAPAAKQDTLKKVATAPATPTVQKTVTDTVNEDECPRGASEPVVKKTVFPNAQFTLQPDHITGIETLTLNNGDKLTIKQSGCEYYVLAFRFETSRYAADTTDVTYWSSTALTLMREVVKGVDVPLEMNVALNKLSARLEKDKLNSESKLTLAEEIDFGGPDPRQYLTIDQITQLSNQHYVVQISLTYGPI